VALSSERGELAGRVVLPLGGDDWPTVAPSWSSSRGPASREAGMADNRIDRLDAISMN
jgi:hypothetical protein